MMAAAPAAEDLTSAPTEAGGTPPEMLGDVPPLPVLVPAPAGHGVVVVPSTRSFKVADNQSPDAQDRVYVSFNYFDNLFVSANRSAGTDLHNLQVYRESFGLEKTCLGGDASVGLRLPLNTLSADPDSTGVGGAATAVGDLSVILKAVLCRSADNNRLLSAGLAVTVPTGPGSFAGDDLRRTHDTTFQPYVGYLWKGNSCYLQGFAALDVPSAGEATVLFNDVGVGYYLYRAPGTGRRLSAVAPTVELHVATPLSQRGSPDLRDPTRLPDFIDLTTGVNVDLFRRTRLGVGVVTPLTGPRPFDVEVVVQVRCGF
jgi:hypothetical protein